jgi:hypothetical protein
VLRRSRVRAPIWPGTFLRRNIYIYAVPIQFQIYKFVDQQLSKPDFGTRIEGQAIWSPNWAIIKLALSTERLHFHWGRMQQKLLSHNQPQTYTAVISAVMSAEKDKKISYKTWNYRAHQKCPWGQGSKQEIALANLTGTFFELPCRFFLHMNDYAQDIENNAINDIRNGQ